jgi:F-box/leucine-rich repeat protein 6
MIADFNKKRQQSQGTRRQAKPKAVYRSQISDNSVGIKLCIKKSIDTCKSIPSPNNNSNSTKSPRKRSRKSRTSTAKGAHQSDSDESYVKRRKKASANNNNNINTNKVTFDEPVEQSQWATKLPKEVLLEVSSNYKNSFIHEQINFIYLL